jgi:hypothetical protein
MGAQISKTAGKEDVAAEKPAVLNRLKRTCWLQIKKKYLLVLFDIECSEFNVLFKKKKCLFVVVVFRLYNLLCY